MIGLIVCVAASVTCLVLLAKLCRPPRFTDLVKYDPRDATVVDRWRVAYERAPLESKLATPDAEVRNLGPNPMRREPRIPRT